MPADHADLRVEERFDQFVQGVLCHENVVRVVHRDDVAGFVVQIAVDGGVLAFALLLRQESEVVVLVHQSAYDVVGSICASAGDDQDLLHVHVTGVLLVYGADAAFDVLGLVVGANSDCDVHFRVFGLRHAI